MVDVTVIDYGVGNLLSVQRGLEHCGAKVTITSDHDTILSSQRVVLPGVGAFGNAMQELNRLALAQVIRQLAGMGTPLLGICLGMQLLADYHAEGEVDGLGLFRGAVRRIPEGPKIPHMGWNQVLPTRSGLPIFAGLPGDAYFYFAHSYYVEPQDHGCVAAVTGYGSSFCSVIVAEHIWGTQFHPEKSGEAGLQLLRNFVQWVNQ